MWRTEWSIFCHEIRTKECPFKHAGSTYKIKLKKKKCLTLELQDTTENKTMHKSKKPFVKLEEVIRNWQILSLRSGDCVFLYNNLEKITYFKQGKKGFFIFLILIQTRTVISGRNIWPFVWYTIHMEALFFPINGFDVTIL